MQDLPARPASGVDTHAGARRNSVTALRIEVSIDGAQCTVRPAGELDMATADQLRSCLHLVREGGHHLVEIDLGGLEFVSLAGLQVLAETQQTLQATGRRLLIAHPDALTVRVLAITGLDEILHVRSDTEHVLTEVAPDTGTEAVR